MRYRILPYKTGSRSAKALATALGGKVLKLVGSTFKAKAGDYIINWGSSTLVSDVIPPFPDITNGCLTVINGPHHTKNASNKLNFFNLMKETEHANLIPEYWTTMEAIPDEAFPVVCRTILSGHSGAGIHIAATRDDLVSAPLYVKYEKKKEEYRIHVGRTGEETTTIAVQRKARRTSAEDVNWQVRNLAGGFVYTREGFTVPSAVLEAAHHCLRETGLDFGAVDVIWNEHKEKAYVLEINTAPGLEGQTIQDYASFFKT